ICVWRTSAARLSPSCSPTSPVYRCPWFWGKLTNPRTPSWCSSWARCVASPRTTSCASIETIGGKGWGVTAKELGIKPASSEFHALKKGEFFRDDPDQSDGNERGHGPGKHGH